jgi:hypothetical protein
MRKVIGRILIKLGEFLIMKKMTKKVAKKPVGKKPGKKGC